ncbi:MAG: hypothetical protein M1832_005662 [Thelocarpon impressellum]|nr:MAG: hypothetical protein M1832_005662 [Thelocarpon impressellum]
MMHCTLQLLLEDKLHYAPIGENPQQVLDIGTGTGIWAMEFGDKYPSAQVTGNDLSPTQPEWVPPNVKFEIDDVESQWTSGLYDYIHSRYMAGAIRDWPKLLKQCYEHTAPDGYAEFHDFDYWSFDDDDSQKDTAFLRWNRGTLEGMSKVDMDPRPGPKLEQWLKDAGFVDVYAKKHKLPLGPWPEDERLKKIGAWYLLNIFEGLEGISMAIFTRCLGWSVQEVQILLAKVRADLRSPSMHVYYEL